VSAVAQLSTLGIVKRTLATLTILSATAFCFLVVMWPVSYYMNLSRSMGTGKLTPSDSISITPHYHLGFERGSLWAYTYEMPYRGSIVWLSDTNDPPSVVHAWTFGHYGFSHSVDSNKFEKLSERACDLPGIYFRRFWRFDDKPPYTTLCMSLWYPILLSAILPFLWIFRRSRLRFSKP
jgi:hypothetical protein